MALNSLCANNVSDEDCSSCMMYGIKFVCPPGCSHYKEIDNSPKKHTIPEGKYTEVKDDAKEPKSDD